LVISWRVQGSMVYTLILDLWLRSNLGQRDSRLWKFPGSNTHYLPDRWMQTEINGSHSSHSQWMKLSVGLGIWVFLLQMTTKILKSWTSNWNQHLTLLPQLTTMIKFWILALVFLAPDDHHTPELLNAKSKKGVDIWLRLSFYRCLWITLVL